MRGTQAVEKTPKAPYGYWLQGRGYSRLGDFQQAFNAFSQAVALNIDFPNNRVISRAYAGRCETLSKLAKLEEATADCARAVQLAPRSPKAYLATAEILMQKEMFTLALTNFENAIFLEPSALTYLKRASAYVQSGDYSKAEKDIAQAMTLDPDNVSTYFLRAKLREIKKQFSAALDDYNWVIAADPNHAEAYLRRAQLNAKLGKKTETKQDANIAISLFGQMEDQKNVKQVQKLLK